MDRNKPNKRYNHLRKKQILQNNKYEKDINKHNEHFKNYINKSQ